LRQSLLHFYDQIGSEFNGMTLKMQDTTLFRSKFSVKRSKCVNFVYQGQKVSGFPKKIQLFLPKFWFFGQNSSIFGFTRSKSINFGHQGQTFLQN